MIDRSLKRVLFLWALKAAQVDLLSLQQRYFYCSMQKMQLYENSLYIEIKSFNYDNCTTKY